MSEVLGKNITTEEENSRYIKNLSRLQECNNLGFVREGTSCELLDTLKQKKEQVEKSEKKVALVNAVWDMFHIGHVSYLQLIEAKILDKLDIDREELDIMVWVESDDRVKERKWKDRPYIEDAHRKAIVENQQQVDDSFVYPNLKQDRNPSDMALYLQPNVLVLHEEHINTKQKAFNVYRKMKRGGVKLVLIRYKDDEKYWIKDHRKNGFSTSNLINKIRQWEIK